MGRIRFCLTSADGHASQTGCALFPSPCGSENSMGRHGHTKRRPALQKTHRRPPFSLPFGALRTLRLPFPDPLVQSLRSQPRADQRSPKTSSRHRARPFFGGAHLARAVLQPLFYGRQRRCQARRRHETLYSFLPIHIRLDLPPTASRAQESTGTGTRLFRTRLRGPTLPSPI